MIDILILTKKGNIIRFGLSGVRRSGRGGKGIRAIRLEEGDEIVSMLTVTEENN